MSRPVSDADRRRDRMALALVGVGVGVVAATQLWLRAIGHGRGLIGTTDPANTNVILVDRLGWASNFGGGLAVAGVLVGVWSFVRHTAGSPSPDHGQEDRT